VGGITAINDDVYQFVAKVLSDTSLTELSRAGSNTFGMTSGMASTVAYYTGNDVLLGFCGLAVLVLLGLMMRT
jgi:hypothetical protein